LTFYTIYPSKTSPWRWPQ